MTEVAEPLDAPTRLGDAPTTPYVGLVPYSEADGPFFFGRDEEQTIVTANLRAARLTILYGPSGVGKSSLLAAGVVRRLRAAVAETAATRPERAPFAVCVFRSWRGAPLPALMDAIREAVVEALGHGDVEPWQPGETVAEALRRWSGSVRTLLVILDQFEDYFLYHPDGDSAGTFGGELPRVVNDPSLRVNFLISIREDAWARLDRFEGRIPSIFANYVRVEHLSLDAARAAIEEPLEEWNRRLAANEEAYEIEPELVAAVRDQVRAGHVVLEQGGRGAIAALGRNDGEERVETAYLQLVMTRLWDEEGRRGSGVLRLSTLDELGGAQTIVRTHLDDALAERTDEEQDLVADLFNQLVTPSGTKIAHTPADLAAYTGRPLEEILPVLERLSGGQTRILRPVSAGEGPVRYEIFHDVLGAAVLDWRARRVRMQLERDREAAETEASHERRRARTFRAVAGLATLLMVVAGVLAVVVWRWSENQQRSDDARSLAATSRDLLDTRLDLAIPLALKAYDEDDGLVETRDALLAAAHRAARLEGVVRPDGRNAIWDASVDRTGQQLVTAGPLGVAVWDRNGRLIQRLSKAPTRSVAVSPRGHLLAAGAPDSLRIWSGPDWADSGQVPSAPGATNVAFSGDGTRLVALSPSGLGVWRVGRAEPRTIQVPRRLRSIQNVAFSPADRVLLALVSGTDRRLRLWDLDESKVTTPGLRGVDALAFSPNGKLLALAGTGQGIRLWSVPGRKVVGQIVGGGAGSVVALGFASDGVLATAGQDRSVALWDVSSVKAPRLIDEHLEVRSEAISKLAFFKDVLAVASLDGTVSRWDARREGRLVDVRRPPGNPAQPILSPDGRTLAWYGASGLTLWHTGTKPTRVIGTNGVDVPFAFAGDGKTLLTVTSTDSGQRYVRLDVASGRRTELPSSIPIDWKVVLSPTGSLATEAAGTVALWNRDGRHVDDTSAGGTVTKLALSADGRRLAWGLVDGRIATWEPRGDERPTFVRAHRAAITDLAFDRTGRRLAVASDDATISLRDAEGKVERLVGPQGVTALSFSRDGKTLASAFSNSTIGFWDVERSRPLGDVISSPAPISDVAFGPRGAVGLTSAGTVVMWDKALWSIAFQQVRDRLCRAVGGVDPSDWNDVNPAESSDQPCASSTTEENR